MLPGYSLYTIQVFSVQHKLICTPYEDYGRLPTPRLIVKGETK